jgi:hypothetical protein
VSRLRREASVFEQPRYVQSTFSLVFPTVRNLLSSEQALYAVLKGKYFQAVVASQGEPGQSAPLVYQSHHGHSQIVVEPTSATLNVVYSPDWQTKIHEGHSYVEERAHMLFDLLDRIGDEPPLFCGSVTRVRLATATSVPDEELAPFAARLFAPNVDADTAHDILVRSTNLVDGVYFNNVTVQNYRAWSIGLPQIGVMRLARNQAIERGIEIVGDFNTRYAFNEGVEFAVTKDVATRVLDRNLSTVGDVARRVVEAKP